MKTPAKQICARTLTAATIVTATAAGTILTAQSAAASPGCANTFQLSTSHVVYRKHPDNGFIQKGSLPPGARVAGLGYSHGHMYIGKAQWIRDDRNMVIVNQPTCY